MIKSAKSVFFHNNIEVFTKLAYEGFRQYLESLVIGRSINSAEISNPDHRKGIHHWDGMQSVGSRKTNCVANTVNN